MEIKKLTNETNKATYFELLKLYFSLDLDIKMKRAPTKGNKINEDKIGKSIK